ncbi:GH39 family glycosyl hydrolase [Mangrovibacterium diazotrophicum]|uniref:Glycosyl hydrolase family 39 n=1 Tax=Mangrovibacterium diazotrophicum TaxID=1261403 RepID=A0A419W616_9BACT|nr:cellulase family glycosylhydrolase [Mangrovibacterium diazotrophicum]RKD90892.1 glycosyl hydrolase family 39 [Mangrovibacterium diazotrophicum]
MKNLQILIFLFSMLAFSNCTNAQQSKPEQKTSQPAISEEVKQYLKQQGIDINAPIVPMLATRETNATVNVNCANSNGEFLHAERYNNFESSGVFVEQRDSDVDFYNKNGLHGTIYRVWFIGNKYYNDTTGKVDIREMSDYLSDACRISDDVMVNCSHLGVVRGWDVSDDEKIERLARILKELKTNFPKIKYIEATNEPDYANEGVTPANYYQYYKIYYKAVNKVNADLNPETPLLVGGPSISQFSLTWLQPFLDAYLEDPSSDKRIDFISFHGYYTKPDAAYILFKDDPSLVKDQRAILNQELASRNISVDIPVFITEMGMYPGPAFDDFTSMKNDHLRQAAGMASILYWYMESKNTYPFNWVMRHRSEGRKDQLVTRTDLGLPFVQTEKFTPYGNMMVMLSKMKDTRVAAEISSEPTEGKGLYSMASLDSSGVAVMVWNYQGKLTEGFKCELNISNLPESLRGKKLTVRNYRIDRNTSNYHANPDNCNLQLVQEGYLNGGKDYSMSLELEPNTLQLVVLEQ